MLNSVTLPALAPIKQGYCCSSLP